MASNDVKESNSSETDTLLPDDKAKIREPSSPVNERRIKDCCCSKCGIAIHFLTAVAVTALISSGIRGGILAALTIKNYNMTAGSSNLSHAFDLMHSFTQGAHVVEYLALLYSIGGFYLFTIIDKQKRYFKMDIFENSLQQILCPRSCICFGAYTLSGIGWIFLIVSTFAPIVVLTYWVDDILEVNIALDSNLSSIYVTISYFSHACHSITRVFMVCVTIVIRFAWLSPLKKSDKSLLTCARIMLQSKWLEDDAETGVTDQEFTDLVKKYKKIGQFVSPLYAIFEQWFIMQWVVYFIKIIEDLSVAVNSLVTEKFAGASQHEHELYFVLTHLVYDFVLFLIPYFCAYFINQYHDQYYDRLQELRNKNSDQEEGLLILKTPCNYVFVPSFCGLSIPLNNSGYNISIVIALFAFIISIITAF